MGGMKLKLDYIMLFKLVFLYQLGFRLHSPTSFVLLFVRACQESTLEIDLLCHNRQSKSFELGRSYC